MNPKGGILSVWCEVSNSALRGLRRHQDWFQISVLWDHSWRGRLHWLQLLELVLQEVLNEH